MPNTREKLIELLCNSLCFGYDDITGSDYVRLDETAKRLLANGVTVQKWIPVTERLPEANVAVLVYDGETVDGFAFFDLSYVSKYGVTHWMPLPEPPKGE